MSSVPADLRYTKDHEWLRLEGNRAVAGITDHAQSELTDVVFVELPKVGTVVKQGDQIGVVESVKAVSEIYAPVGGTVIEVNASLSDAPEVVNQDPYGKGWLIALEVSDAGEAEELMDAAGYRAHIGG